MSAISHRRTNGDLHALGESRQSEERLQAIVDTIPSFVWRAAPDGAKEYLNQRWHEYTGISPAEAYGWGWKVVVHPDDLDRLVEEWLVILASRRPGEMEVRIRRFDGEYRWFLVRAVPKFDENGNIVNWFGSNTDIEDRKRAEERARQNELELRGAIDAIPQAIVVLQPDGRRLFANRFMLDYTGMSPDHVHEDGFYARKIHKDDLDRVLNQRKMILERAEPGEIEQRILRKDGQYLTKRDMSFVGIAQVSISMSASWRRTAYERKTSRCGKNSIAPLCLRRSSDPPNRSKRFCRFSER
jgi:PAS domain S-box-containing protein